MNMSQKYNNQGKSKGHCQYMGKEVITQEEDNAPQNNEEDQLPLNIEQYK